MATSEPEKDDLISQPELAQHLPNLRRPTMPDRRYMELLWENGQIVTHSTVSNYKASIPSTSLIQVPEEGINHVVTNGDDQMGLVGKGLLQTAQLPCSDQTTTNINQEPYDEMNPSTLDCPVDDIYMELFSQVSGIDLDDSLSLAVLSANEITGYSQVEAGGGTHALEINPSTSKDSERCLEGRESLFQQQCQTFMSSSRPKDHSDVMIGANLNRCGNGDLPAIKMQQTQDPASGKHPSSSAPLMNFSHFSRLAAQVDSNFEFMDGMSNSSETACAPARGGRSLMGSDSDRSANEMMKAPALFHGQMPSSARSKQDLKLLPADQHAKTAVSFENSEPICWEDDARHASKHNDQTDSTANLRMPAAAADDVSGHGSSFQGRRSVLAGKNRSEKPVLTTSPSMCSANVVAGASPINDIKSKAKWKTPEGEASEYRAEDCEDDSASTIRKPITRKSASIKRSRGVGLHSFSERRRRDRINEKIRALRRLIPNCSKVDKATTLNEAIEYLRALQMQLQIMSMYGGLHMMPVMLSSGTPPMGMGFNMGMGFGMGMLEMAGPSMLPMPHMQGPVLHPYGSIPRTGLLHGMPASTNLEMFRQGSSPMSIPHPTTSMAPSAPVSKKKVNHAPEVPEQAMDSALPSQEDGAAADHRPTRW